MNSAPQFEPQFKIEASLDEDGLSPAQCVPLVLAHSRYLIAQWRYNGGFFPGAKRFVVAGGKFKSITNIQQAAPSAPPGEPRSHIYILQP
jgi:hypothetical protein